MAALPKEAASVTVHVDVSSLIDDVALQAAAGRIRTTFREAALAGINSALVQAGAAPLAADAVDGDYHPEYCQGCGRGICVCGR